MASRYKSERYLRHSPQENSKSLRLYSLTLGVGIALFAGTVGVACNRDDDTRELLRALEKANVGEARASERSANTATEINPRLLRRFEPIRKRLDEKQPAPAALVDLGRMLYFEKRLSKNHDLSCNTCHDLARYGVDNEVTSPGHNGARGKRNSPTVYNSAGAFVQFWDGRAANSEEQATGPIVNPIETAASPEYVKQVLESMAGYREAFRSAFPTESDPVHLKNVGIAIGAFERGLTTESRWDKYLSGDKHALSTPELRGLQTFTNVGCMVCHTGELLGGSMYQKLGAVEPWPNQNDAGRYEVTKNEADRMVFRVPTLRNVAKTAPYFHDGSAATLPEAIRMMGKHQLGINLSVQEVTGITAWLGSLTGELPGAYIARPNLPESTTSTPKPNAD